LNSLAKIIVKIFNAMQRVIIIGATSGIGLELAKFYIKNNAMVGATGRRRELLDELQKGFSKQVRIECFDVMGNDNIFHVTSLIEKLGGVDILIYNSGFGDVSKDLDWQIDKQTTQTNVNGFVEIVNYAFNYFAKQGHGQIAATSSIGSIRGNSWAPAYSASKAFMSVYMEGLHMKAKKMNLNIAVTDILPGFVNTKMAKGNKQFWIVKVEKAVKQIFDAIKKKKRRVYVSPRWRLIAWIMKWMPYSIYRRIA
jgi:short-subunit dehydrogenase